jgi:hypothetical protein
MKKWMLMAVGMACVSAPEMAMADPVRAGFGMDVGLPSGAAVGFVLHPGTDVLSLQTSLTYNALNFGGRAALKIDPMALARRLPIGVFLDVQGGFAAAGNVPGHTANLPSLGYDYANLYGGLRLGRASGFHWNFELGPSYLVANTGNFQSVIGNNNGLKVGNPSANMWITPTFETGFEVSW